MHMGGWASFGSYFVKGTTGNDSGYFIRSFVYLDIYITAAVDTFSVRHDSLLPSPRIPAWLSSAESMKLTNVGDFQGDIS